MAERIEPIERIERGQSRPGQRPTIFAASAQLASSLWLLGLLVVLVFMPAGRFHVLGPILALSAALGGLRFLADFRARRLDPLSILILGFAAVAILPVGLGMLMENAGVRDVAIALVGGPVAWFATSHLADRWAIERLPSALAVGTLAVAIAMFMLLSGVGSSLVRTVAPGAFGEVGAGVARVSYPGTSSLVATVPFLVTMGWDSLRPEITVRNRWLVLSALAVGLIAALASGRQGVIGVLVLTPVLIWLVGRLGFDHLGQSRTRDNPRRWLAVAVALVCGAVTITVFSLNPSQLVRDLLASVGVIESQGNARVGRSAGVRAAQARSLLSGWSERPVLGHGAGAVSDDFHTWRGYELGIELTEAPRPWRAELSYHLLLFEAGVFGLALYAVAAVVAWRKLCRRFATLNSATARMIVRASVVASLALAISTAANPLARTIGLQWSLMLPVIALAGWSRELDF